MRNFSQHADVALQTTPLKLWSSFRVHSQIPTRFLSCRIQKNEDGTLTVHYMGKDGVEKSLVAGIVMFGTGRKPNTNRLGVDVRPSPT